MFSGPLKLTIGAAAIAAVAGMVLSSSVTPPAKSASPAAAPTDRQIAQPAPVKGWFAGWFEGMEFNRGPAPAVKPAAVQAVAAATGSGYGRLDIKAAPDGQYHTDVEIDGQRIPMLVDTGATLISLTSEDASRLGIRPSPSDYTLNIQTANGGAKAARVKLPEVRVGTLSVRGVDAIVLPREVTGKSLLGMSFLQKLGGFEITSGNLVLRQ